MVDQNKYVVGGRASICHWSLRAEFLKKDQVIESIKKLLEEDIDFPVEFTTEFRDSRTVYVLEITDMSWANNLKTAAEILKSVDYPDD